MTCRYSLFLVLLLIMAAHTGAMGQSAGDTVLTVNASRVDSISPDNDFELDQKVEYFGKDSTVTDIVSETIRLYGDAWVKYGSIEVKAPFISFSFGQNIARATGLPDSTGKIVGKAIFRDGDTEFSEDSLAYNFKTKKGISYGARTQEGDAYLIAGVSKKQDNDWVDIKNGMFTTCDREKPHYHFRLSKGIVVPNEKVVSGPLFMKVGKVPTPLALPFGFFPNKKTSTHGILLPGYGNAQQKGYFLQNLGYYLPLGQYLDTRMLFDVYTRGSWVVRNVTNYRKLYRYNGSFNISRAVSVLGLRELPTFNKLTTFNVRWNHAQDPKSRPNTSFNANVNLGSSQNFRNNLNSSLQDFLSTTFQSAVQYGKSWAGTPFSMAVSANHTQNTQSRDVQLLLPSVTFTMSRINILKQFFKRNPVGLNWTSTAENSLSAKEQELRFDNVRHLRNKMNNGVRHGASLSTSLKLFRGIVTFNPSANASWFWAFREVRPLFAEGNSTARLDTVSAFRQAVNWNASASFNTRIYGTFSFRGDRKIKAIRHFVQPAVGWSYTPYQSFREFGFYGAEGAFLGYSPWDAARFRPQSTSAFGAINLSVTNNFEAKVRDKSSAKVAYKKVKLIESVRLATNYNLFADSLNWSNINLNAFTTIGKVFTITYSSTYSMYARDTTGRQINRFIWQDNGQLLRGTGSTVALSFRKSGGSGKPKEASYSAINQDALQTVQQNPNSFVDFTIPWNLSFNYNLRVARTFDAARPRDARELNHAITLDGGVTLFKRWAITLNSGYNFNEKEFTTSNIGLHWDLHCWELSGSVVPFGRFRSFMVQLNIKSPLLKDLKVQRRGTFGNDELLR